MAEVPSAGEILLGGWVTMTGPGGPADMWWSGPNLSHPDYVVRQVLIVTLNYVSSPQGPLRVARPLLGITCLPAVCTHSLAGTHLQFPTGLMAGPTAS